MMSWALSRSQRFARINQTERCNIMGLLDTLAAAYTYLVTHFDEFLGLLGEHLTLVLVSVTLAIVVAVRWASLRHETNARNLS